MMRTSTELEVGFYGKLPSHGDFLRRRVSDAFVGVWDGWLQECIASSRAALGERWLDVYLTSPAWRFACSAGVFGREPVIGLMVPSVDRVGRYFHLTLVAALPEDVSITAVATAAEGFLENAERLVVETLAAEHVDFDGFDRYVMQLAQELAGLVAPPPVVLAPSASDALSDLGGGSSWQIPMGAHARLGTVFEQLLSRRLAMLYDPLVIWWTDGSAIVEPSCLIGQGLPHPEAFAALLDGAWTPRRWQSISSETAAVAPVIETLVDDPMPPRFRSSGLTDVGRVRSINQDSFLDRSEVGLWVVADGLGGHSDGEVASRMVCDALADFVPDASFEQMVDAACERIQQVNAHLIRAATREHNAVRSGSTVVALLVRGTRCAIVWAGDSRVYRLRQGRLEQLTRDHSLAEVEGVEQGKTSSAITRAVGGEETLLLDVYRDRVRVGDRFLLCSDGLTRTLPDAEIQEWLERPSIQAAVDGLIATTLEAGAPDNVTVVVVEAFAG